MGTGLVRPLKTRRPLPTVKRAFCSQHPHLTVGGLGLRFGLLGRSLSLLLAALPAAKVAAI